MLEYNYHPQQPLKLNMLYSFPIRVPDGAPLFGGAGSDPCSLNICKEEFVRKSEDSEQVTCSEPLILFEFLPYECAFGSLS